jgi:hypothetical protein
MRIIYLSLLLLVLGGCATQPDPFASQPMPYPPPGRYPMGQGPMGTWMPRTPEDLLWVPGAEPVWPTTGYRAGDPVR